MNPHNDLREELHELERRVAALELSAHPSQTAALPAAGPEFALPNIVPALGRTILGLAGGYLLRALAESGPVPRLAVVLIAVLYAGAWLFLNRSGLTAALILSPLLWEATVRLNVLPHVAAAGILAGFTALSSGALITTIASVSTAIGLMVGTGDPAPFACALLAIAAIDQRYRGARIPSAIAAAFGTWFIVFLITRPGGVPVSYTPIAQASALLLCTLLFAIAAAGIAWRAVWLRGVITAFEIGQATVAFLIAAGGALQITQGRSAPAIGALCAAGCAVCYFTAFMRFPDSPRRNHYVFAGWGAALGLAAALLILPDSLLVPVWSAAAVIGILTRSRTFAFHGAVFLAAAGLAAAVDPTTPALTCAAIAASACYAQSRRAKLSLVPAIVAAMAVAGLLIPVFNAALIVSALALAFAFAGYRTGRLEMLWIAYAAIALGTLKLLAVDFRQSRPAALAVSLLCYGALLLLMPRLTAKTR